MAAKLTKALNLSERETVNSRIRAGETMTFSGDKERIACSSAPAGTLMPLSPSTREGPMACVEITDDDFDDMHHALGRPSLSTLKDGKHYRNHYAIDAGSGWSKRAELLGFWDRITAQGASVVTYRVNSDGKSALADWLELRAKHQGGGRG